MYKRQAVTKHTKDELILQSTFADLEDFYETIVLPPPARKPKGKPTVENHVRYLETHLVEKLKEKIYVSFEDLNADIKKIVAVLNKRSFQGKDFSRLDAFEKVSGKPTISPGYASSIVLLRCAINCVGDEKRRVFP